MLKEVLDAREARWNRRLDLVGKYRLPVLTFTLNIPGPDKTRDIFTETHKKILDEITSSLEKKGVPVVYVDERVSPAGPEAFIVLEGDASQIKRLAVSLEENHPIGRILDLDVMDTDGVCLSRDDMGIPQRACIMCGAPARECIVMKRHDGSEILARVTGMVDGYLKNLHSGDD